MCHMQTGGSHLVGTNVWFVMHALVASQHPCTMVAINGVDDVCEDGENNSAHELTTPRKPNNGHGVAGMQTKLGMAAQSGKLRVWTRPRCPILSMCLV